MAWLELMLVEAAAQPREKELIGGLHEKAKSLPAVPAAEARRAAVLQLVGNSILSDLQSLLEVPPAEPWRAACFSWLGHSILSHLQSLPAVHAAEPRNVR